MFSYPQHVAIHPAFHKFLRTCVIEVTGRIKLGLPSIATNTPGCPSVGTSRYARTFRRCCWAMHVPGAPRYSDYSGRECPPTPSHSARRHHGRFAFSRLGAAHPGHAAFTALHRVPLGRSDYWPRSLPFSLMLIGSLLPVPSADLARLLRSRVVSSVIVPPQTPWYWW